MNTTCIPATESDRAFFIQAHHTAYRNSIEAMFGWQEELQDKFANAAFTAGGMHVIWNNDQPAGVVGLDDYPGFLVLKEFFLLPEFQRKGIGQYVIEYFQQHARDLQKPIRLRTLKANQDAKRLYEKCGFCIVESTDIHWIMQWSMH